MVDMKPCDVCRDPGRATTTYTVNDGEREGATARCAEHGRDLAAIVSGTPAKVERTRLRSGGPPRPKLKTMEEIEALKRR
jgi:hypothetical protein